MGGDEVLLRIILAAEARAANKPTKLTAERLRQLLEYDPETGKFTWKVSTSSRVFKGMLAGTAHIKGYITIGLDKKNYLAHRLAWLYMTGKWPPDQIDHINGDRSDSCFSNLRLATHAENMRNSKLNKNSSSGVKGVYWSTEKKIWVARIYVDNCAIHLGLFTDIEDAATAYEKAAKEHFGEFARPERETRKQPPVNLRELGLLD